LPVSLAASEMETFDMVQSGLLRQSATVAREKPNGFIPCPAYPQKRWQKFRTRPIQSGILPVGSKSLTVPE
jgi:hypothetical protein